MNNARMVGLRVYLCISGALSAHFLFTSPHVFPEEVYAKLLSCLALVTISALGVVDTLINDVLGDAWRLKSSEEWRHHGYIALALANLAVIFVAISRGTEGAYLARFAIDAAMSVYVAFRDVQIRFIKPRSREESREHADYHA